jgi:hypothetical protein
VTRNLNLSVKLMERVARNDGVFGALRVHAHAREKLPKTGGSDPYPYASTTVFCCFDAFQVAKQIAK